MAIIRHGSKGDRQTPTLGDDPTKTVAQQSGLTIEDVEAVEDNDVDSPFQRLARYAEAVGLQFELQQIPA